MVDFECVNCGKKISRDLGYANKHNYSIHQIQPASHDRDGAPGSDEAENDDG